MQMGSAEIETGQIGVYADETVTKDGIHKFLDVAARFPHRNQSNLGDYIAGEKTGILDLKYQPKSE